MMSLPPDAEYPMEHFEWGLPAVQIYVSSFAHDWRYIDFQTGHFVDFKQFKTDSHFLPLGKSK